MLPQDLQLRARARFLCRYHDLYLEPKVRALFAHVKPVQRNPQKVLALHDDIDALLRQLAGWVQPRPFLLAPTIGLADCGPLVTLPLATLLLAACGQPLTLPAVLEEWLKSASAHPDVVRALTPWRSATQAWLAS
jgi:glutathione S-transferase